MEIIDQSRISLPPNSAHPSAVPLSFLDLPVFFLRATVQRVLFYNLPGYSAHQFTDTALPSIKRSLSAALQRFFPLAGGLVCIRPPGKPHILCSDSDSVDFIAAVSSADFNELTSDSPQVASLLNHLVPPLGPSAVKDGTRVASLLAVQIRARRRPHHMHHDDPTGPRPELDQRPRWARDHLVGGRVEPLLTTGRE